MYGEITALGLRKLAARLVISADDVFVECVAESQISSAIDSLCALTLLWSSLIFGSLGSGRGRACFQAAKEFGCRRAIGVELAQTRHELAETALHEHFADLAERVTLLQADVADPAIWSPATAPLASVSVVFAGSLMFGDGLMSRLARLIEQCDSVRVVATLKRWPAHDPLRGFIEELPAEVCETSWTAPLQLGEGIGIKDSGCPVFVYVRE